jgi:hypothetical protein
VALVYAVISSSPVGRFTEPYHGICSATDFAMAPVVLDEADTMNGSTHTALERNHRLSFKERNASYDIVFHAFSSIAHGSIGDGIVMQKKILLLRA